MSIYTKTGDSGKTGIASGVFEEDHDGVPGLVGCDAIVVRRHIEERMGQVIK